MGGTQRTSTVNNKNNTMMNSFQGKMVDAESSTSNDRNPQPRSSYRIGVMTTTNANRMKENKYNNQFS